MRAKCTPPDDQPNRGVDHDNNPGSNISFHGYLKLSHDDISFIVPCRLSCFMHGSVDPERLCSFGRLAEKKQFTGPYAAC